MSRAWSEQNKNVGIPMGKVKEEGIMSNTSYVITSSKVPWIQGERTASCKMGYSSHRTKLVGSYTFGQYFLRQFISQDWRKNEPHILDHHSPFLQQFPCDDMHYVGKCLHHLPLRSVQKGAEVTNLPTMYCNGASCKVWKFPEDKDFSNTRLLTSCHAERVPEGKPGLTCLTRASRVAWDTVTREAVHSVLATSAILTGDWRALVDVCNDISCNERKSNLMNGPRSVHGHHDDGIPLSQGDNGVLCHGFRLLCWSPCCGCPVLFCVQHKTYWAVGISL